MNPRTALQIAGCTATVGALIAVAATALAAHASTAVATPIPVSTTTTVAAPATTTTTLTAPVTPPPVRTPSPAVQWAQRRLSSLRYDPGPADGVAGVRFRNALIAFQKAERLQRTGELSRTTIETLAQASTPPPVIPDGPPTRVEVDITRQVLLFWRDGELVRVLPVSTGSGHRYCVDGACSRAVTPIGVFTVTRKVANTDSGPLGPVYWPLYFHNGVAIHGYPSVPVTPQSHGCVRIPMESAAALFADVPVGTAVYVVAK
jgi:peptidoglycan hydrolase-like protein with peptidoglycan-binding domain